jgi:CP family cyanate transporter-like MFS transporter
VAERASRGSGSGQALSRAGWINLALLWLGGFDLRVTLLAVPPVIPYIHRDLGLDEKGVSLLIGLPVLLLAAAAVPGALLIAWLGARRALITGLLAIALGSMVRGAGPSVLILFSATLLMGIGVAVSQPAFPTLSSEWFPLRVGVATAVYSNGMLVGETVPASLTGPLLLPALHGSWPLSFAFWSLPVLLAAILLTRLTWQRLPDPRLPRRWWPNFRNRRLWQLGLVMGSVSAAYFGSNAFIPDFVRATGRPQLKDAALAAINVCQLPASLVVLAMPRRLITRRWPLLLASLLVSAGLVLMVVTPGGWIVAWAGLIGFAAALTMVLTLAVAPLLAEDPGDVHRFSAGIFLIVYSFSFAGPLVAGAVWDATRTPASGFLALAAGGLLVTGLGASLAIRPVRG